MKKIKRTPIRLLMLKTVLLIVAASLIVTSIFAVVNMFRILTESESALTKQATENLSDTIDKKTAIADLKFKRYREMVISLSHFVDEIYKNYDRYEPMDIQFADPKNGGKLVMQPVLANDSIKWEDVKREAGILANAADHFEAVMLVNTGIISSIYFGVKDGFILSYDDRSDMKPLDIHTFNYFDTDWYKLVEEKQEICFTDVYDDIFGRGLVITCAGPVHDRDGNFCGVLGIDLLINDLYSELMDFDLGEGAKFFVSGRDGKIISLDPEKNSRNAENAGINLNASDKDRMGSFSSGVVARGDRYYAFDTIETVNWMLCVTVPQSSVRELANTISRDITSSIMIFVVFILIILLTGVVLVYESSKKITQPLTNLTNDIKKMHGDLGHRAQIQGSVETAELAEQFNELADSLQKHINDITSMTAEKERFSAELDIATKIQADMLPSDFPDRKDLSLYAVVTPAKEVGGDFYDFFFVDDDRIALVIADVAGKGIPAALLCVVAKTVLRNQVMIGGTPAEIMQRVNKILINNSAGFFVTIWLGILDLKTGDVQYTNAGHEYPIIGRNNEPVQVIEEENCPPVATSEDVEFINRTINLRKGDSLFLYTDGVPEAKAPEGSRFGMKRLRTALDRYCGMSPQDLISRLKNDVDNFAGGNDPFDDITMMYIVRK